MNITINNFFFEYFNMIPTGFSDKVSNFNLVFELEITFFFRKSSICLSNLLKLIKNKDENVEDWFFLKMYIMIKKLNKTKAYLL